MVMLAVRADDDDDDGEAGEDGETMTELPRNGDDEGGDGIWAGAAWAVRLLGPVAQGPVCLNEPSSSNPITMFWGQLMVCLGQRGRRVFGAQGPCR